MSDLVFEWLAFLLNLVKSGVPWPDDTLHVRAAFLSKDPLNLTDPLAYRVLLILPTIYRRWASTRFEDMRLWVRSSQLPGIFAGVEWYGAEDAWWESDLQTENFPAQGIPFSGSAADMHKCFDQVQRPLLYHLAEVAGIP